MSQTYRVRDGQTRVIEFDGVLLAEVSSRRKRGGRGLHWTPRWTELRLYKTDAGTYVLEKMGASVVVHAPNCPNIIDSLPRFQEVNPGADPADGNWWFCEDCGDAAVGDITSLLVEASRHWATITDDPAQVVDALYRRKDGARSMPRVSLDLLDEVGKVDPSIHDAFRSEFVL